MHKLTGRVQHYAWGSHRILAELTGREAPTAKPEAELWLGAHEAAPSIWDDRLLDAVIAADPPAILGAEVSARWEQRLPFLLKVLAPARALSIQCHPDAARASAAVPGTYTDRSPKPEAVVALTPFELFGGMATHKEIVARLSSLDVPELQQLARESVTAHDVLTGILAIPPHRHSELVTRTFAALDGDHVVPAAEAGAIQSVQHDYPGDIGLIVLLTMRHRILDPGSYAFVPAGVLHVYLSGAAVEVQANSDNVVRAGLTPKKVDVQELLRIVDVDRQMIPEVGQARGRVVEFPVSVPQFRLVRVQPGVEPEVVSLTGPRIVLCIGGTLSVHCDTDTDTLELGPGESTFLTAWQGDFQISGTGTAYVAAPGHDS